MFGRVNITNQNFTDTTEWSSEWNNTLDIITEAYKNLTNINGVSLVQLEQGTGVVYYEVKVKDKAFIDTPAYTYLLNGSAFGDTVVNNGGNGLCHYSNIKSLQ